MKQYKNFLIGVFLMSLILLTGCSPMQKIVNPYDEDFHCKAPSDTGECMDTPTAYLKARYPSVDSDQYLDDGDRDNESLVFSPIPANARGKQEQSRVPQVQPLVVVEHPVTVQGQRYKILSNLMQQPEKPVLAPPKILRVLLLPYTGEGEELFMSRFVYVQVEKPKWILSNIKEN